jgi:ubiquinone/menaquinone biosynthesis C-methylase UbiE
MVTNMTIAYEGLEPEILEGNKSGTLNGTGYVFFSLSPLTKIFLRDECLPSKRVVDIGTGFSEVPIIALQKSVLEYVANDISKEHLDILLNKAKLKVSSHSLNNLTLLPGKAPEILNNIERKVDAILADKVIHFFTPNEIKDFIIKSNAILKAEGKIYVTAASPYSKRYNQVLKQYVEKQKAGEEFPGHFVDIMDRLEQSEETKKNYPQFKVPNSMVLFTRADLVKLFSTNGMKILASYSLKIPTDNHSEWIECLDQESNVVGIIAQKRI